MAPAAMNTTAAAAEKEKEKALEDWLPITSSRNAKWWYSAFDNVTAMVGAGVLSLPYAMSELGWSTDVLKGKIIICGILVTICALNVHRRFYTLNAICAAVAVLTGWRGRSTVGAGGGGGGGRMAAEGASFCEGAPLNSSGYGEERRDSNIHALGLSQSRAGDGGSSSAGTLVPPPPPLYLDSGAAHHVVNDDTILINVRDPPAGTRVMVADGSEHLVTKVGDIHTQYIKIKDVYHVPQLQMCLVSVGQLTERKIDVNFSGNRVELLLEGTRIGYAIIDGAKLYRLLSLQAP